MKVRLTIGEPEESVPTLGLRLESDIRGDVDLVCTTPAGREYYIATVRANGTLYLYSDLPNNIGLDVDGEGEITTTYQSCEED